MGKKRNSKNKDKFHVDFIELFFVAGLTIALSPAALLVLPRILLGETAQSKRRSVGFIVGFIAAFLLFTLLLSEAVQLMGLLAQGLRYVAILLIGFFGFTLLSPHLSQWFARILLSLDVRRARRSATEKNQGALSGLLEGGLLGLSWSFYMAPLLVGMATLLTTDALTIKATLLAAAYSLGVGVPLLFILYKGRQEERVFTQLAYYADLLRKGAGSFLVLLAIFLAFNWDSGLTRFLSKLFPAMKIEETATLEQRLDRLKPPATNFPSQLEFNPTVEDSSNNSEQSGDAEN